jgi:hypothetical protein
VTLEFNQMRRYRGTNMILITDEDDLVVMVDGIDTTYWMEKWVEEMDPELGPVGGVKRCRITLVPVVSVIDGRKYRIEHDRCELYSAPPDVDRWINTDPDEEPPV